MFEDIIEIKRLGFCICCGKEVNLKETTNWSVNNKVSVDGKVEHADPDSMETGCFLFVKLIHDDFNKLLQSKLQRISQDLHGL